MNLNCFEVVVLVLLALIVLSTAIRDYTRIADLREKRQARAGVEIELLKLKIELERQKTETEHEKTERAKVVLKTEREKNKRLGDKKDA